MPRHFGSNAAGLVEIAIDIPAGFVVSSDMVPNLAYPFELMGIANVPIAARDSTDETGMPHADLIPARGILLWMVAYDSRVRPSRRLHTVSRRRQRQPDHRIQREGRGNQ